MNDSLVNTSHGDLTFGSISFARLNPDAGAGGFFGLVLSQHQHNPASSHGQ